MAKFPIEVSDQEIVITALVPGGQGIGTAPDGKKGFFWNVLPGEIVTRFSITKSKANYFEAIATEIAKPSEYRVEPEDACYLATSPYQMMDYNYELEQKALILNEIMQQAKLPQPPSLTVQTDNCDFHYRNKMEYALYWNNETSEISLAFHARGSHRKMPITKSSIERPEIFAKAEQIVADLNAQHAEARKYQSLLLRCNQNGKVSGGLLENGKAHPVFDNLSDTILGQEYSYSPNGFFQINLPVYEMALKEIKKQIKTQKVLDLYAGVGTIGLSVASDKNLTLVESNKSAFTELEHNAQQLAGGCVPILAKSEECLEYIAPDQTVILDPPRAGCDKKLIEKLLEIKPQMIIYLSCNPVTQIRDVKMLTELYHIMDITPYNFFPRTPHLENLVVLGIM